MSTRRLFGLPRVHCDLSIDIAAAVNEFSRRHPRRMQMEDMLSASSIQLTYFVFIKCVQNHVKSKRGTKVSELYKHPPTINPRSAPVLQFLLSSSCTLEFPLCYYTVALR